MLITFLKTARRSLLKNKVFTIINIAGLSIGMAACFFILSYVYQETSFEKYNPNAKNIYRVPLQYQESSGNIFTEATNQPAVGPALKENFPEVISFARLIPSSATAETVAISTKEKGVTKASGNEKRVYSADAPILRMLAVPMLYGDDSTALSVISSAVISESMAKKYFGNQNPMGKTIYENHDFPLTVTGVFKDRPGNSHLNFDMLISFPDDKFHADNWTWSAFYTYVMLAPGTDPSALQKKFPALIEKYLGSEMKKGHFKNSISLQPISDIHLTSHYRKEMEPNANQNDIWVLSILCIFVLVIAYINYVNLSTAKVMERASEVGIRKVIGASKSQLVWQFLTESFLLNCIAVIFAGIIVLAAIPFYEQLVDKSGNHGFSVLALLNTTKFWLAVLVILVAGSFMVGMYPALLMSRYNPMHVLKGKFFGSQKGIMVRKVLGGFQFMLSIILIAGSLIVFKQLAFMRNQSLGYTKDQVLIIKTPGVYHQTDYDRIPQFQRNVESNPSAMQVSISAEIPGEPIGNKKVLRLSGTSLYQNTGASISQIDNHFFSAYGIPLLAGRNFEPQDSVDIVPIDGVTFPDKISVVANESLVQGLGFTNNKDALGKLIHFTRDYHELTGEIIGVVKNYHQTSLKDPYQATLYVFPSRVGWRYISVHLAAGNPTKAIARIEEDYKKLFPSNPFDYFFQDDYFNQQYKADQRFATIFNLFTGLSIFVSCLGLIGLLNFVVRIRTKEIGIRRVLGASVYNILVLFFKDFFKLILVASVIALPVIYYAGSNWLNNYAFHTSLHYSIFVLPPLILTVITLVIVITQSLQTTLANPVTSLRDE